VNHDLACFLLIVALFTIVMWDRLNYMVLLMFHGLACLLFFRISFSWIPIIIYVFIDWLLSFSKSPKYRCHICFWQYCIDFIFKKKIWKWKWFGLLSYKSFSSLDEPPGSGAWGDEMLKKKNYHPIIESSNHFVYLCTWMSLSYMSRRIGS